MKKKIRLILADDHPLFTEGLRLLLRHYRHIDIIGEAKDGGELLELAAREEPDVVITDIEMPVKTGIEATSALREKYPDMQVIALTMFGYEPLLEGMIQAGANGYLLKTAGREELLEAIETVHQGGQYFCSGSMKLLSSMINRRRDTGREKNAEPDLSEKELTIIRMICEEYSTKEIAGKMHMGLRTIEKYREKIMEKIGVRNMAGVVVYAVSRGIYRVGS